MGLSKQQMIGAVGGGVFALGVLGLGFFLYSSWDEKSTAEAELESQQEAYTGHFNAPVFPSKESIAAVKANATSYNAWYEKALALAARGDKAFPSETPPIFKQRLQDEVRRLLDLPGGANGKIAAPAFLFGFEQLLGEGGALPASEEVPELAVQLDAIAHIVDLLSEAGVSEVKSIERVRTDDGAKSSDDSGSSSSSKASAKKGKEDANAPKRTMKTYKFGVAATPEAIVDMLNKLAAWERFAVVRNLSFKESVDSIDERVKAAEKARSEDGSKAGQPSGSRRRRGAAAQAAQAAEAANPEQQAARDRNITEPAVEPPLTVTFTVDVYDFGRPAAEAKPAGEAAAAEDEKPAEAAPAAKEGKPAAEKAAAAEQPAAEEADEKKGDNE